MRGRTDRNAVSAGYYAARAVARSLLNHPKVLLVILAIAGFSGLVASPRIEFEAGIDVYFDRDSPLQAQVDAIDKRFINDDLLFVVYQAPDVFSKASLETIRGLHRRLERVDVPSVESSSKSTTPGESPNFAFESVTSLTSIDDLIGGDMSFRSEPLVPDPVPSESIALELARTRARANPVIEKTLLGRDRTSAMVVLRFASDLTDRQTAHAVRSVRRILANNEFAQSNMQFHLVGASVTESDIIEYQREDLARFIPVVYILMAIILFGFLRVSGEAVAFFSKGRNSAPVIAGIPPWYAMLVLSADYKTAQFRTDEHVHLFLDVAVAQGLKGPIPNTPLSQFRFPFQRSVLTRLEYVMGPDLRWALEVVTALQRYDVLVRPSLSYDFGKIFRAALTQNWLLGNEVGFFGMNSANSRVAASLTATF